MMRRPVLIAVAVLFSAAAWQQSRAVTPRSAHEEAEIARLRAHFDVVDSELRARDVSSLSAQQRTVRAQLIEWLRDYRDAGQFPANEGHADVAVPIFRDADGTLCAMAYLIQRSGRGDIVDRVERTRNTAYIRELVDDPALVAWLAQAGLSAGEAARIQPWYDPEPDEQRQESDGYAVASLAIAGSSLIASYANLAAPTLASGVLGILAGSAAIVAGVPRLDAGGDTATLAIANTALGTLTIGAALHALRALRSDGRPVGAASSLRVGGAELSVAPAIIDVGDGSRPGLRFRAILRH